MTDAMLEYRKNSTDEVDFALINAGGIRATIDVGPITRGEVLTSFPFGNAIVELTLSGEEIWKVIEGVVTGVNVFNGKAVTSFFQISSGIKVEYNPEAANGTKLVSITVGDSPIDNATDYTVVTLDFLAGGGDNIFTATTDFVTLDTQDQVLTNYILSKTPVDISLDGRIAKVNGTGSTSPTASGSPTATGSGSAATGSTGAAGSVSVKVAGVVGAAIAAIFLSL